MNRTQKFAMNSMMSAVSHIITLIAGLITPRLLIATYGSEMNGLVTSLNQIISYIALVEAGVGGAAIYSLYKPLAKKDNDSISSVVTAARKGYRQAGYIFSTGVFGLAVIYAFLSSTENISFFTIFALTLVLGLNGCLDFFLVSGYRVLLTADQRNYITSSVTIMQTVLRTIIICSMVIMSANVVLLYFLAMVPAFLKACILLVYCRKKYSYVNLKAQPDKSALKKRWDVIYQQILNAIQMGAPTVIATIILNFVKVSIYSVYNMVISGINGIMSIFISGLPAGFGELIAKKEYDVLRKSTSQFEVAYYYLLSVIYGITAVMILPFITIYTKGITDADYYSASLAFVMVLNGILYNIKTPQSMLIQSAGMYEEMRWRATVQGLMIIVLGVAFGIPFGLVGIMIGSCLSNLYRTVDLAFFVPKNITNSKPWKSIFRMILVFLNVSLIFAPTFFINIHVLGYLDWFIYAISFGVYAIFVVTITTFIFDRKDFVNFLKRIKSVLLNKRGAKA